MSEIYESRAPDEALINCFNGKVGSILLSENAQSRIWYIHLSPGEFLPYHRHVSSYFWTCLTYGRGKSHIAGSGVVETRYYPGKTRYFTYKAGEYMVHDLKNCGETDLIFITVEFLGGENTPLQLPDNVTPDDRIPENILKLRDKI